MEFKNYLFIFLFFLIFNLLKIESCVITNTAGAFIDLTNLSYQTAHSNPKNYDAVFGFCGGSNYISACKNGILASLDSYACQVMDGSYYQLGASTNQPVTTLTDYGFKITYLGAAQGGCTSGRILNLEVTCDPTVLDFSSDADRNTENPMCTYNVYGKSKYACKTCDHLNNCNSHGSCNANKGACDCNDQFDGPDCSTSRLLINNVVPTSIKGGSIKVQGYFGTSSSAIKVTLSNSDDDDEIDCEITSKSSTEITCTVGPGEGTFDVKVEDNGYDYMLPDGFTYQYLVCDPVCSSIHGKCNKYEGTCECDDQTQGDACLESKLKIDSVLSTSIKGGDVTINGYFGTANSLQVLIYSNDVSKTCIIQSNSSLSIKCVIGPGEGTYSVKVIDRDLEVVSENSFTYQYIVCNPVCNSIHGKCDGINGVCECDSQTFGEQCQNSKLYLSSVTSTTIEGGKVYLFGYFGEITPLFNIKIGQLDCKDIQSYNDSVVSCNIGPGTGYQDVTVTDNDLSTIGKSFFKYFKTVFECPNNCTQNGECDTKSGSCLCNNGYTGFDCGIKINNNKPSIPKIDLKTGSASISNENFNYQLNILSLAEISVNGSVVKEHPLTDLSNIKVEVVTEGNGVDIGIIAKFVHYISSVDCSIHYTIEEIIGGKKKDFQFADVTFSVESGSLKTTINITNYQFESNLNTLQLRIKSAIDKGSLVDNCNSKPMQVNSDQLNIDSNFNYLQVSKDSKIVSSRFLGKLISDNRISPTQTLVVSSNNETLEMVIGLNIPHFSSFATLDPDFGVLLSNDYVDKCSKSNKYKIITIAVVVPCVVLIAVFLVAAVLYKKHYLHIKIFKDRLSTKPKRRSLHL